MREEGRTLTSSPWSFHIRVEKPMDKELFQRLLSEHNLDKYEEQGQGLLRPSSNASSV